MADKKKSRKFSKIVPVFVRLLIAFALAFFAWLKLADRYVYIFNTVFNCYTFAFFCSFAFLLVYLLKYIKKNDGNFDLNSGFITLLLCILLVCLVNNGAKDIKNSKVNDIFPIGSATDENPASVLLCEITEFNSMLNADCTSIAVYRVNGRIAKKLGVIDEAYFSVECLRDGMYDYFINHEKNTVTIECSYGSFGDGIIQMNPAFETGKIQYVFKLD